MLMTKMDANGRVLLPIGMRYKLDLNQGDRFAIDHLGEGTIILKKIDSFGSRDVIEKDSDILSDIPHYSPEVVTQMRRADYRTERPGRMEHKG
jgi:AbrB family looped-hinge helix DNA binding protein